MAGFLSRPSPSPATRGFPGSSLFLERAKRLPDAGPRGLVHAVLPARPSPPLRCAPRPTRTGRLNSSSPLVSVQLSFPGAFPSLGGWPVHRSCAQTGRYIICRVECNTKMRAPRSKTSLSFRKATEEQSAQLRPLERRAAHPSSQPCSQYLLYLSFMPSFKFPCAII